MVEYMEVRIKIFFLLIFLIHFLWVWWAVHFYLVCSYWYHQNKLIKKLFTFLQHRHHDQVLRLACRIVWDPFLRPVAFQQRRVPSHSKMSIHSIHPNHFREYWSYSRPSTTCSYVVCVLTARRRPCVLILLL